jgi:hypothetical protein
LCLHFFNFILCLPPISKHAAALAVYRLSSIWRHSVFISVACWKGSSRVVSSVAPVGAMLGAGGVVVCSRNVGFAKPRDSHTCISPARDISASTFDNCFVRSLQSFDVVHRSRCWSCARRRRRQSPKQRDLTAPSHSNQLLMHPSMPTLSPLPARRIEQDPSHGEGEGGRSKVVKLAAHRLRVDPALSTRLLFWQTSLTSHFNATTLLPGSHVFGSELKL